MTLFICDTCVGHSSPGTLVLLLHDSDLSDKHSPCPPDPQINEGTLPQYSNVLDLLLLLK